MNYKNKKLILAAAVAAIVIVRLILPDNYMAFGIKIPKGYDVHGIDVSRYQGKIDWNGLENIVDGKKKIKISFVFLKATEGRSMKDPMFDTNWKNIEQTSLIRGAYHYFIPTRNASEQAKNFIACVDLKKGDLPPVLDVEVLGTGGAAKLRENMKIWLKEVEKHYGIKPIIYSYIDFYESYLVDDDELKNYMFWVAHYYRKKITFGERWHFWQCSDKAKIQGINEHVDFNVFNGSLEELKKICKK